MYVSLILHIIVKHLDQLKTLTLHIFVKKNLFLFTFKPYCLLSVLLSCSLSLFQSLALCGLRLFPIAFKSSLLMETLIIYFFN